MIRIAHSQDGLTFADTGKVFRLNAAAPDLIRLPKGELLAIFDSAPDGPDGSLLAVSRSDDDGRSWSQPRPVRLSGLDRRFVSPRHGDLLWMSDGTLRLYFAASPAPDERRREEKANEKVLILSATTHNGEEFKCDPDVRLELDGIPEAHPTTVRIDKRIHLYAGWVAPPGARQTAELKTNHWTSTDGRRFEPAEPVRLHNVLLIGNVVSADRLFRAYLSTEYGLSCLTTSDGREFKPEKSLQLRPAVDPAVVRLKDESWLMFYCIQPDEHTAGLSQLADAAPGHELGQATEQPAGASDGNPPAGDQPVADAASSPDQPPDQMAWEPFPTSPFEIDGETFLPPGTVGSYGSIGTPAEEAMFDPNDPFPPKPDFQAPVDYLKWFQASYPSEVPDNAYADYQALREEWKNPPGLKPAGWPDGIIDMLNGEHSSPIGPWDPAEHPDWEQTHQALSGFLDRLGQATWHENLMYPPTFGTAPEGFPSLINLLLPNMADNRGWVKAAVADAWRMEDGRVLPERMLDRFGTVLRNATLIGQGPTLVNDLVRTAEQRLVEDHARLALRHGVFTTPDELAAAYNTLAQYDLPGPDPVYWLPGEQATFMEVAQYLFPSTPAGGEARADPDRVRELCSFLWRPQNVDDISPKLADMTLEDVQRSTDRADGLYRQMTELWRTGYPQVHPSDLEGLGKQYADTDPLIGVMFPGLSRAYQIQTRVEASRRATQLTFAVHLYKAQTGTWPASLADLPPEFSATIRTDPFTGGYFGYQLTESGPKIYSLGEDGVDNGGVHSRNWGDDRQKGGPDSDDFVFWPEQ